MLTINISELVLTIASFFLLLFVLNRLLFRPLLRFMEARQAKIDAGLKLGAEADAAVQTAQSDSDRLLDETRRQAAQSVTQAGLQGQKSLADAVRQLSREAETAAEAAQARTAALRESGAAGLEAMSPQLAELLAQRLLR